MLYTYQRLTLQTRPAALETGVRMAETNTVNAARYPYVDFKAKKTMSKDDQMIGILMYFTNCTKTLSVHSLKHVHMIEKKETTQQPQRTTLAAH
jgi:hypothetical protein